jgi:hypothetical protein
MGKSSSLGMPTHPKKYPKVQASKLGDAPEAPLLHRQKSGHLSTHYFYCFMHYAFFLERLYFSFLFCLVLFAAINGWTPTIFFGEVALLFICQEHSVFILIVQRVFSLSATAFNFHFSPSFLFRSCYISTSRCILTSGLCWFSSKELFQKGSNGVRKEKKFHAKKWYKKELV